MTMAESPDNLFDTEEWRVPLTVEPRECIEGGESVLILGRPGTGKSTLTNELVEILEEKGQQVVCAAKTMWPRAVYQTGFRATML